MQGLPANADAQVVPFGRLSETRPFVLRSRRTLILSTVLLQALVIGLGWLAMMHGARTGLARKVEERMHADAARLAAEFSAALNSLGEPVRPETDAWRAAQRLVEQGQPQGGTLVLLDPYGRMLCHPALEANPGLLRVDFGEQRVRLLPDGEQIELGSLRPNSPIMADADLSGGAAIVGLAFNRQAQAKVLVVFPRSGVSTALRRVSDSMMLWVAVGGAAVLVLTVIGSILLVRRYDTILMRTNARLESELARRVRRGLAIRNGLIFGLAKLADYRDTDTGRHLERICRYSEVLARALRDEFPEIDDTWIEMLTLAASMHDIGKVGIPDAILLKPGVFTPEERREMEKHPLIGADTLVAIRERVGDDDLLNMGVQITLSHHERWDGKGYPYGLAGEQIPLSARIVALADMYDALTSRRVYKPAMSHEEACRVILESRGRNFDPRIVDAFERVQGEFDRIRAEMTPPEGCSETPWLLRMSAERRVA
jgi:response regulator RpfG family c-di-GMP phosphodiesterase